MIGNPMRISGLASGLDIDAMVDKLMQAERKPLDKMKQDRQKLEWRRDDYRDINKRLDELSKITLDMRLQSTYLTKKTSSSDDSKVTATASGNIGNAAYTLSGVNLATSAHNESTERIADKDFDPNKSLSEMRDKFQPPLDPKGSISFKITTYDQEGKPVEKAFDFDQSTSLNHILKEINRSNLGINAFYDHSTGKVSFTRTDTGNMNENGPEMAFSGDFLTDTLKLDSSKEAGGKDASFILNGLQTTRHSNSFTVNGVTFNLKNNMTNNETVTITVENDTDAVYQKITDYINKYNEVMNTINEKISEVPNRDYPPLTDNQKKEMKDDEIKLWENKAKSGMLHNDSILSSLLAKMRTAFYSPVTGVDSKADQLAKIGITASNDYKDNGKLIIDPDKLKQAIADDPQGVMALFTKNGDDFHSKGIAKRLDDDIKEAMNQIKQKAGNAAMVDSRFLLGQRLEHLNDRIKAFQNHLNDVENQYYKQFNVMEQAIDRANQQAAFIQNQFGGGA
ncbi:flagellar hook-associated protein 2 [Scopulibacillus daqui]|uniref:Flagellar hook-associated protein 2 n=1 Tax=Scopulibacillus daqui TaxID=1469162 RepID=A0ABS2PZN5_9BACL|nr:flagellar hook-associated protein 2 [Scopulibacillus daqui]MBM7645030.1 flagellar hook-associated protein 2 [Scopulibacillus daqui]